MTAPRRALLGFEVPTGVLGAGAVLCACIFRHTGIPSWIPPAPLVRAGIPSPMTGMTRSFVALASGHVAHAFAWHPLGPLAFAACAVMPFVATASWIAGHRLGWVDRLVTSPASWWTFSAIVGVGWIRQLVVLR